MVIMRIITSVLVMLYLVFWLHYMMRKGAKGRRDQMNDFLTREREANAVRKKEIPPDYFITPDTRMLPVAEYPDDPKYRSVRRRQEEALKKSTLTMMRLPEPKNNTELKFEFGVANLEKITRCEENFHTYIRALNDWAEALLALDLCSEAEVILKEAVALRSDLSKSYTLLGNLYLINHDKEKLTALYDNLSQADSLAGDTQFKRKILNQMEDLMTQSEAQEGSTS